MIFVSPSRNIYVSIAEIWQKEKVKPADREMLHLPLVGTIQDTGGLIFPYFKKLQEKQKRRLQKRIYF